MKPLIVQWHHAARCRRETSQRKANNLWNRISDTLRPEDRTALVTAWSHCVMAEQSPSELDSLMKKLVDKYKNPIYSLIWGEI